MTTPPRVLWEGECVMEGGPKDGDHHHVMAPMDAPPVTFYFAPVAWAGGEWVTVGYEPGYLSDVPWPGQVCYDLDRLDGHVAFYRAREREEDGHGDAS